MVFISDIGYLILGFQCYRAHFRFVETSCISREVSLLAIGTNSLIYATKLNLLLDVLKVYMLLPLYSHINERFKRDNKKLQIKCVFLNDTCWTELSWTLPKYFYKHGCKLLIHIFCNAIASCGYQRSLILAKNEVWSRTFCDQLCFCNQYIILCKYLDS